MTKVQQLAALIEITLDFAKEVNPTQGTAIVRALTDAHGYVTNLPAYKVGGKDVGLNVNQTAQ